MKAGWLRHVIQIQAKTRTPDGAGGFTEVWATVTNGERRASITDITSDEDFAEDQNQERITQKVTTRYLAGVTTGMRVKKKDDARIFDIRSVIDVNQRHRMLVLRCLERKAA